MPMASVTNFQFVTPAILINGMIQYVRQIVWQCVGYPSLPYDAFLAVRYVL